MQHFKIYVVLILTLLLNGWKSQAQGAIRVSLGGSGFSEELRTYFEFEDINYNTLFFTGDGIKNKQYRVVLKEFRSGVPQAPRMLFDGSESEYFRVSTDTLAFKLLSKISDDELKLWIRGEGFGSKKTVVSIDNTKGDLAFQSYTNADKVLSSDSDSICLFSFITPKRNEDGSGSWCDVTGSGVDPEKIFQEFDIPHYFLIEILFTE
ncbi:hypothetical protein [Robertkochia solimangrovi]|uniref:hypothetical protein n=1 Tax=Robertkochia solimangrovi TaxID=2213046 RepID=UPI00118057F0|nr:hypothetical protein [Robertkochia solimangrovi]TRZ45703.1 hypothetical protein DMZ48_00015 [Robertkochia solimangrovi]